MSEPIYASELVDGQRQYAAELLNYFKVRHWLYGLIFWLIFIGSLFGSILMVENVTAILALKKHPLILSLVRVFLSKLSKRYQKMLPSLIAKESMLRLTRGSLSGLEAAGRNGEEVSMPNRSRAPTPIALPCHATADLRLSVGPSHRRRN
jgi:hypothetical protein